MTSRERGEKTRAIVFTLIKLGLVDGVQELGGNIFINSGDTSLFVTTPDRDGLFTVESMHNLCRDVG